MVVIMKAFWPLTSVRPAALRLTLAPALALLVFVAPGSSQPSPADLPAGDPALENLEGSETADLAVRPQGRLRKLHLVRPDLILYPIAHEIYC